MSGTMIKKRCSWPKDNPDLIQYHDEEWGQSVHEDRMLLEYLILEGAQAGLNWKTVLNKRENYRKAFCNFDAEKIASYGPQEVQMLLQNQGIIRNRLKIQSAIQNARMFLKIQKEFETFDNYVWSFVDYKPIHNTIDSCKNMPTFIKESDTMSKDMRKRGFTFVGTTIVYAFMQAVGMVNDHEITCFRYAQLAKA